MRVWDSEEETVKKWFCDHCGKRYDQPGICTDGHASQPVELQEVNDPVNPPEDEYAVPEPTDEEKAIALAEQGKDAVIANLKAHVTDVENQLAQSRAYAAELEQKIAATEAESGAQQ